MTVTNDKGDPNGTGWIDKKKAEEGGKSNSQKGNIVSCFEERIKKVRLKSEQMFKLSVFVFRSYFCRVFIVCQ